MGIGTLSAILGVLYALTQNDLKRLLAYSTIENAGIILLGLGAGMTMLATGRPELAVVAIAASLYHVMNHAAFKGLLFLGAGSVVMATATRQLEAMGGLLRRMPWTGVVLSRRRARDLGCPTAQRLRQRMADVSGVAARVRVRAGAHARELPAGRRAPGADECARRRLLRQGVRHRVSRAATQHARQRRRTNHRRRCSCRWPSSPSLCLALGLFPGFVLTVARTRDVLVARAARRHRP